MTPRVAGISLPHEIFFKLFWSIRNILALNFFGKKGDMPRGNGIRTPCFHQCWCSLKKKDFYAAYATATRV
jgi:hypothetical protein